MAVPSPSPCTPWQSSDCWAYDDGRRRRWWRRASCALVAWALAASVTGCASDGPVQVRVLHSPAVEETTAPAPSDGAGPSAAPSTPSQGGDDAGQGGEALTAPEQAPPESSVLNGTYMVPAQCHWDGGGEFAVDMVDGAARYPPDGYFGEVWVLGSAVTTVDGHPYRAVALDCSNGGASATAHYSIVVLYDAAMRYHMVTDLREPALNDPPAVLHVDEIMGADNGFHITWEQVYVEDYSRGSGEATMTWNGSSFDVSDLYVLPQ